MRARRFPILLLLLVGVMFGCAKASRTPAKLKGSVSYKSTPVTGGTIAFYFKEGGRFATGIRDDGTYSITDLPVGDAVVTVETESINPEKKAVEYKGGNLGGGMRGPQASSGMKLGPIPEGAKTSHGAYVKIPAKYKDQAKSGLTVTVVAGSQSKNFELSD